MDDLDALLEDLGRPKSVAPTSNNNKPRAPSSKVDLNELEDLMHDLAAPTNAPPVRSAKPAMSVPKSAPAPAPTPAPTPTPAKVVAKTIPPESISQDDDLDALMASLNNTSTKGGSTRAFANTQSTAAAPPPHYAASTVLPPPPPPVYEPLPPPPPILAPATNDPLPPPPPFPLPAAHNHSAMDDLDELLSNLEPGKQTQTAIHAPTPAASFSQTTSNHSTGTSNGYSSTPSYRPPPPAASSNITPSHQPPSYQPSSYQPSPYQPPSATSSYKAAPPAAKAPAGIAKPIGGDDLDNLLQNLSSQMKDVDHKAPTSRGTCTTCRNPIMGEIIQAMGNIYHPEHFVCGNCQNVIGTSNFYEQDKLPHCEKCYQELFCARCAHCDEPILDRCVTALNKKWHTHHFICTQCLGPFEGGSFFEKDSRPYCEKCFYGAFASRCASCNQPIKGECVNALGQQWHPEHFVCQYCQKSFAGGAFYEYGGKPYCEVHYHQQTGSLCSGCGKAITGRCVNALDKKWHPEHFVCAFCMNPLAGGAFTENSGKAYCKECHGKLFG